MVVKRDFQIPELWLRSSPRLLMYSPKNTLKTAVGDRFLGYYQMSLIKPTDQNGKFLDMIRSLEAMFHFQKISLLIVTFGGTQLHYGIF